MTDDPARRVRGTDPGTSQMAAERGRDDDRALRVRLLVEWAKAGPDGFTDYEAADAASLLNRTYWKRAGELREPQRGGVTWEAEAGGPLLAWHPERLRRKSLDTGAARAVSVITPLGLDYLRRTGQLPEDPAELHAEILRLRRMIVAAIGITQGGGTRAEVLAALRDALHDTEETSPHA
jgi:hypothetical protein